MMDGHFTSGWSENTDEDLGESDHHLEDSDNDIAMVNREDAEWLRRIFHLLGNPSSVVDFAYEEDDEELGHLI